MIKFSLSILLSFTLLQGFAQTPTANINTPMPTVPFGSNTGYEFGTMPTNLPSGGTYGASQDAADAYVNFVNDWIEYCGADKARVKWSTTSETVSEGIAYGLIISVYAGDKDMFDRLWAYYKQHMDGQELILQ